MKSHLNLGQYKYIYLFLESESEVAQSCPTPCDPMDCSLPGSSVHGFSRQEYWSGLPFPSPGESSWPRDRTQVSLIVDRHFTAWATREVLIRTTSQTCWITDFQGTCNPQGWLLYRALQTRARSVAGWSSISQNVSQARSCSLSCLPQRVAIWK